MLKLVFRPLGEEAVCSLPLEREGWLLMLLLPLVMTGDEGAEGGGEEDGDVGEREEGEGAGEGEGEAKGGGMLLVEGEFGGFV